MSKKQKGPEYKDGGTIERVLWWAGWRPIPMPIIGGFGGLALGNAIAIPFGLIWGIDVRVTMIAFTLLGVFVGLGLWYRGTMEINSTYEDVINYFEQGVSPSDDQVTTYTLISGATGSSWLIESNKKYFTSYLVLDDSSMGIFQGSLNMVKKQPKLKGNSVGIPYDRISSVKYDSPHLKIRTDNGDLFQYESKRRPDEVIHDLRSKLKVYTER